jgi:hypothetical protein
MNLESEANPAAEAIEVSDADAETLVKGAEEGAPEPYSPPAEEPSEPDELDKLVLDPEAPEGEAAELAEVEYEGKQYKLPPELKDALLRQSDYTKKTMSVAEERKAVEAAREQLDTLRDLSGERMEAVKNTALIRAEIERIENTPAQGLTQEQIDRAGLRLATLQNQLGQWEQYGQTAAAKEKEARDQQFAKDRDEAWTKATAGNKNLTEERKAQLAEYISASGGDPTMINSITDPVVWQVLHDADIGRRFTERQRKAAQIKAAQATQPAPEVGGKSSSKKSPDEMSPAEMAKFLGYK